MPIGRVHAGNLTVVKGIEVAAGEDMRRGVGRALGDALEEEDLVGVRDDDDGGARAGDGQLTMS
jgi:hypothetical protein